MSSYITEYQRYQIETMLKDGKGKKEIAERIGKYFTTVYREIKRGTVLLRDIRTWKDVPTYCADVGQRKQEEKGHNKGRDLKIGSDHETAQYIEKMIVEEKYSPEAVVFQIRKDGNFKTDICTTTLYSYIDKQVFLTLSNDHLQYKKATPEPANQPRRPSLKMLGAKTIEERPDDVYGRDTSGHWEMDTVVSGKDVDGKMKSKACVLSIIERKSREVIVRQIPDRKADTVTQEINKIYEEMGHDRFSSVFLSITCDNGVEFSDYQNIEVSPVTGLKRTDVYFCHPFCSSERGSNENVNRLIRRWIPKGSDISQYSAEYIQMVQNWINNYPRRMFGGLSSNEYRRSMQPTA